VGDSIIVPIYKKGDIADCRNHRDISLLPNMYKILSSILLSRLTPHAEEIIWDHRKDFDETGHILLIYYVFIKYSSKNGNTMKQ